MLFTVPPSAGRELEFTGRTVYANVMVFTMESYLGLHTTLFAIQYL